MNAVSTVHHYRVVDLDSHCPAAATSGLAALVDAAQQTIQTSVDLLGAGGSGQVPDLIKSLDEAGLVNVINGSSVMVSDYSTKLKELTSIKSAMQNLDSAVDSSTYATSDITTSTWAGVGGEIRKLQATLDSTPGPRPGEEHLSPSVEAGLQTAILSAVTAVHDDIQLALNQVQMQARAIRNSQPPSVPTPAPFTGTRPPVRREPPTASPPILAASGRRVAPNGRPGSYGSGGYDSKYTQPVSAALGSTQREILSKDQLAYFIGKALDALGITDPAARANWTKGYLVLIQRESGGNIGSINLKDSNAAAGHPSQGLTQTIPGTFSAYHVAGTSNSITDPTANIASSMNYVMHRYHVSRDATNLAANVEQADPSRPAKGY